MKKILLSALVACVFQFGFGQSMPKNEKYTFPNKPARQEICLNGLWNFKSNTDNQQTHIQVPSCYTNVWGGKWGKPYWDAFNYPRKWTKGAMYERNLLVTDALKAKNLRLHVDGCFQNYSVLF